MRAVIHYTTDEDWQNEPIDVVDDLAGRPMQIGDFLVFSKQGGTVFVSTLVIRKVEIID